MFCCTGGFSPILFFDIASRKIRFSHIPEDVTFHSRNVAIPSDQDVLNVAVGDVQGQVSIYQAQECFSNPDRVPSLLTMSEMGSGSGHASVMALECLLPTDVWSCPRLVSGLEGRGVLHVHDPETGKLLDCVFQGQTEGSSVLPQNVYGIVSWNSRGRGKFHVGGSGHSLLEYDMTEHSLRLFRRYEKRPGDTWDASGWIMGLHQIESRNGLVTVDSTRHLQFWDVRSSQCVTQIKMPAEGRSVIVDGDRILAGFHTGEIGVYDIRDPTLPILKFSISSEPNLKPRYVYGLCQIEEGHSYAAAAWGKVVSIFDRNGKIEMQRGLDGDGVDVQMVGPIDGMTSSELIKQEEERIQYLLGVLDTVANLCKIVDDCTSFLLLRSLLVGLFGEF